MKVSLIAKTFPLDTDGVVVDITEEQFLDYVASQSRNQKPKFVKGLFERTVNWGHNTIQEFATYIFHIEGVSRVLLAQLTRHRIASYNVMSFRHVPAQSATVPEGIKSMDGNITLESGEVVRWNIKPNGDFSWDLSTKGEHGEKKYTESGIPKSVPLQDIRFGFPMGLQTNIIININGSSLRNFLNLRLDTHAQWEIRELACKMFDIIENINPVMVNKFIDKRVQAVEK